MDVDHIQLIREDFGDPDSFDYKYEALVETVEHFLLDTNEELKKILARDLDDKLDYVIRNLRKRATKLNKLRKTLTSLGYY